MLVPLVVGQRNMLPTRTHFLCLLLEFLVLVAAKPRCSLFLPRCQASFLPVVQQPRVWCTSTRFSASGDNDDTQDETGATIPSGFNPFSYQASRNTGSGVTNLNMQQSCHNNNYSTRISLRKTKMSELNQQLLNATTELQLQRILESNKDFLLEPLEDDNAVLEEDSIYTPSMNRAQRYETYRKKMEERLASSQNPQARRILTALKDFVLRHQF